LSKNKLFVKYINPTIQHQLGIHGRPQSHFEAEHPLHTVAEYLPQPRLRQRSHRFATESYQRLRYFPNIAAYLVELQLRNHRRTSSWTAGAGWVGEINNQFKRDEAGGKLLLRGRHGEDIPPEIPERQ